MEQEGQAHGLVLRHDAGEIGDGGDDGEDRAGADLVDVLRRAAQLHVGEQVHLEFALGACLDLLLEDLHHFGGGVVCGKVARHAKPLLGHGRGVKTRKGQGGGGRKEEGSAKLHGNSFAGAADGC